MAASARASDSRAALAAEAGSDMDPPTTRLTQVTAAGDEARKGVQVEPRSFALTLEQVNRGVTSTDYRPHGGDGRLARLERSRKARRLFGPEQGEDLAVDLGKGARCRRQRANPAQDSRAGPRPDQRAVGRRWERRPRGKMLILRHFRHPLAGGDSRD